MKGTSRLSPLPLLLALIALVLSACGAQPPAQAPGATTEPAAAESGAPAAQPTDAPEAPPGATDASKTLILATEGSPPSFDPLAASDSRVDTPSLNIYSTLVQVKPGTVEIENDLAESYEAAPDGLSYTFKLREGVQFHDGTELTAADVKYTVDRMLALQKGVYRSLTPVSGAEVVDDYTVTITLSAPFPGLTQALTRLYILNAKLVQANEEEGDWGQKWLQANASGTGPYTLVSFQPEQQFTLERFESYHRGWGENYVDRAIFRVIKEEATRRLALEQGDIDWMHVGSADTLTALEGKEGLKLNRDVTLNQLYFAFMTRNEYLQDVRVRQALALVYDYAGHVEQVRNGNAEAARGPIPSTIPCFNEAMEPSAMNLDQARALMAEAGFPDGGFELEMAYQGTSPEETAALQLMQAGAAELGVTIKPLAVEWPAKVGAFSLEETAPAIGTIWIFPGYPDPDQYLFRLAHSSQAGNEGLNFAYYSNTEMDQLLVQAQSELDQTKRCELYKQAQELFVQDMPYASVVIGYALSASRDYVEGYTWTPSHAFAPNVYPISIAGKP